MSKYLVLLGTAFLLSGCTPTAQAPDMQEATPSMDTSTMQDKPTGTMEGESASNKSITLNEVALHATKDDCWTVVDGTVANVTSFFGKHPGGDENLAKACGVDATQMFQSIQKHDPNGYKKLQTFKIGTLAE